jgi:hypothetical protein
MINCQTIDEKEKPQKQNRPPTVQKPKEPTSQDDYKIELAKKDDSYLHLLAAICDTSAIKKDKNFKIIESDVPEHLRYHKAPNYYKFSDGSLAKFTFKKEGDIGYKRVRTLQFNYFWYDLSKEYYSIPPNDKLEPYYCGDYTFFSVEKLSLGRHTFFLGNTMGVGTTGSFSSMNAGILIELNSGVLNTFFTYTRTPWGHFCDINNDNILDYLQIKGVGFQKRSLPDTLKIEAFTLTKSLKFAPMTDHLGKKYFIVFTHNGQYLMNNVRIIDHYWCRKINYQDPQPD